jgi:hypothetical protein
MVPPKLGPRYSLMGTAVSAFHPLPLPRWEWVIWLPRRRRIPNKAIIVTHRKYLSRRRRPRALQVNHVVTTDLTHAWTSKRLARPQQCTRNEYRYGGILTADTRSVQSRRKDWTSCDVVRGVLTTCTPPTTCSRGRPFAKTKSFDLSNSQPRLPREAWAHGNWRP